MSSAGESIGGRYRLIAELGAGGMGRVWKAHDLALEVDVAIKEVQLEPSVSAEERAQRLTRAQREARTAAQLRDHPNVVAVYDVLVEDERPWIVMSLVRGTSLAELVRERGPLAAPTARNIAEALLSALSAAHKAGIVHRDVKPANVLLAESGAVLLSDFGIAKRAQDTALTGTGFIGSLEYVAPERARGGEAASPADLFSLGATLYHAVTGSSPFRRDHPAASLSAVLSVQPPRPENAGELADLIMALLAKEPEERPTAAQALDRLAGSANAPSLFAAPTALAPAVTITDADADAPAPAPQSAAVPVPVPVPAQQQFAPLITPAATPAPFDAPPISPISPMQLPTQQLRPPLVSRALIVALAFSPDGQVLAGGGGDGVVQLWNSMSGVRVSALSGHAGDVRCLAFSPDGGLLASGGEDGRIRVWDLRSGRHFVLAGHNGPAESVAFSPDAPVLASGGADGVVRLWDVRTGACMQALADHVGPVYTVVFGADGGSLAAAGGDSDLLIWNPRTGARLRRVRFENADLSCFLYGPGGELFIGVHGRGRQHLEQIRAGRPNRSATGPVDQICCVTLSSGGRVIATGSETGAVQLWDTANAAELVRIGGGRQGAKNLSAVLGVALSRDGGLLAAARDDRRLVVYGRQYAGPPY